MIEKQTVPDGDAATFDFTGEIVKNGLGDGQDGVEVGCTGTYTVTETAKTGWDLTGLACDDSNSTGSTSTRTATFIVAAGETVKCTYTNTKRGSIVIEKQTVPDGDAATFDFTGEIVKNGLGDGQTESKSVAPGTYTVTETAKTGWDLTGLVCDDSNSTGSTSTRTATFIVAAGETVKCTYTNTKRGSIVIEKQTVPDGDSATFDFTGEIVKTVSVMARRSRSRLHPAPTRSPRPPRPAGT